MVDLRESFIPLLSSLPSDTSTRLTTVLLSRQLTRMRHEDQAAHFARHLNLGAIAAWTNQPAFLVSLFCSPTSLTDWSGPFRHLSILAQADTSLVAQ